jgi:peptidoglycan hydrolase CwlO-like protein
MSHSRFDALLVLFSIPSSIFSELKVYSDDLEVFVNTIRVLRETEEQEKAISVVESVEHLDEKLNSDAEEIDDIQRILKHHESSVSGMARDLDKTNSDLPDLNEYYQFSKLTAPV